MRHATRLLAAVSFALLASVSEPSLAAEFSMLGEQDFADGFIVPTTADWIANQQNEGPFFTSIYVTPGPLQFTHSGIDTGRAATLTVALWDADVRFEGDQLLLTLDGLPQSVVPFEAFALVEQESEVRIFEIPVAASLLVDGELVVSIGINEPPPGNNLGIDFSLLEIIPAECEDEIDNDGDGYTDFAADPGCQSELSPREQTQCQDGISNDGDGLIDFDGGASLNGGVPVTEADPQCIGKPFRNNERPPCGLGAELVLFLPLISTLRRGRSYPSGTRLSFGG